MTGDATLHELLAEPIVRLLMARDGVTEDAVQQVVRLARQRLASGQAAFDGVPHPIGAVAETAPPIEVANDLRPAAPASDRPVAYYEITGNGTILAWADGDAAWDAPGRAQAAAERVEAAHRNAA